MAALRRVTVTAAVLAFASAVLGQTTSRTFHLTNVPTVAGLRELGVILRTLDTQSILVDEANQDISVSGTADELALAGWLVQQLDVQNPPPTSPAYTVAGGNDTVRILYLSHTTAQVPLNELVTTLRTVGDIQRIFTYSPLHAVAIRTTVAQAQLAQWMVQQLDVPSDKPESGGRFDLSTPGRGSEIVEVVYLAHPLQGAGLNEIVTTIRTVADVQKIFTHSSTPQGIVFRSDASHVQLADWLFHQIDAQPDAQARAQKHEYLIPDSTDPVARIYYLNASGNPALYGMISAIRSEAEVRRIFFCNEPRTLAIRATPDKIAVAERIIKEQDR